MSKFLFSKEIDHNRNIFESDTVGAKSPVLTLYAFQKVLLQLVLNGPIVLWTISYCHSRTI